MNLGILFQVNNSVRCYSAAAKLQPITPVLRTPGWVPVRPVDAQPVRPRLHPTRPETTSEPGASGWSMMARILAWLSLIILMICGLGWQRAEHARKEHRLARELAKAESREAVLYRNHNVITSGLVEEIAALKLHPVDQAYYASAAASERRPRATPVQQTRPETQSAGLVRHAVHQRAAAVSAQPSPAFLAPTVSGVRARSLPGESISPRSVRTVTKL